MGQTMRRRARVLVACVAALVVIGAIAVPAFANDTYKYVTDVNGYNIGRGWFWDSSYASSCGVNNEEIAAQDLKTGDGVSIQTDLYLEPSGTKLASVIASGGGKTVSKCAYVQEGAWIRIYVCKRDSTGHLFQCVRSDAHA